MRTLLLSILLSICCISAVKAQDGDDRTLDSLIAVYNSMDDDDTNKVRVCSNIATIHYSPDSTIVWADRLIAIARINNMLYYVAKAYDFYSWSYYEFDDFEKSMSYSFKALLLADSIGNAKIKAQNYFRLANTFFDLSNYELSDNYFLKALDYFESAKDTVGCASCYRSIADNYAFQKMYDPAIDLYGKALRLDSAINKPGRVASDYRGMGDTYYRKFLLNYSNPDLEALQKAKCFFSLAGNANISNVKNRLLNSCHLIDVMFWEQKYSDNQHRRNAIIDFMRVICNGMDTLLKKMDYNYSSFRVSLSRLLYLVAARDFDKARAIIDSVDKIVETEGITTNIHKMYLAKSCYYEASGNMGQAMIYMEKFYEYLINETSVDFAVRSTTNQMRMEYDRVIADKDRKMESFSSKVNWAISLILLFVAFLVFFYYKNSKHRNALDNANRSLLMQREEIESQRDTLKSKNKQITDSVNYAQVIQTAVLPKEEEMGAMFPEHFIIYRPLNTVSGDFYWITRIGGLKVLVCADCTGHGVPGGFLSMLGISILNDIFGNYRAEDTAAMMLDLMRDKLMRALGQSKQKYENGAVYSMDGIDLALVIIDEEKSRLQYAGAYRPLLIWREGEIITYKPDKMPIGLYLGPEKNFSNNIIDIQSGDVLYMFSDGMPDQFGYMDDRHEECAHFSSKRFAKMLKSIGHIPMAEQKAHVERVMEDWRNGYPQLDDNILIGIRI